MYLSSSLLKLVLILSLIINIYLYMKPTHPTMDNNKVVLEEVGRQPAVRMAIINAVRYHGEVWYSYLYAAAIRCHWHVSLFTVFLPAHFGSENGYPYVTRTWSRSLLSRSPPQHVEQLLKPDLNVCSFQIIVVCTLKHSQLHRILDVLLNKCDKRAVYLLLLQLHQARTDLPQFEKIFSKIPSLQSQKRVEVRYLALAEHVKHFAEQHMNINLPVDVWRPGHPLDLPAHTEHDQYHPYFDYALQGKLEDARRNYSRFAADITHHQDALQQHKIAFTIVGMAKTLTHHKYLQLPGVRLFLPPNYMPANVYYSIIHQAVGIVPAFGTDDYYVDTQSSSIFCSILTQTPLLASQRLLDSHTLIPAEAVWLQYDNESDVAAILRIMAGFSSSTAFRKALFTKRQRLKTLLEQSYASNERTLNRYARAIKQRAHI